MEWGFGFFGGVWCWMELLKSLVLIGVGRRDGCVGVSEFGESLFGGNLVKMFGLIFLVFF